MLLLLEESIKTYSKNKQQKIAKNICIWNPATCSCKNGKYVESIIDDSVIMCDGIMEETKTIPTKSTSKKIISTNFCVLLAVLLMITVIIYFYLIKHQSKE